MKKRSKKYRPREIAINPIVEIFGGMGSTHAQHLQTLHIKNHAALAAMVQGRGTRDDWDFHTTVALLDENRWMNTGSSDHNVNWHGAGYLCEFGQKYWSVFGESRSQCLDAVTHWMPIPPAPASSHPTDGGVRNG